MLQRQILFKRLQEMQHQQQLRELSDARQHSFVSQLPFLTKQTSAGLHPPPMNGMPVHDTSQMFMVGDINLMQHGTSPIMQRVPNGLVFSQAQGQAIGSNGVLPEQFDASLCGSPIASLGNNRNPYFHIQEASHSSASMLNRGNNNQWEIPEMHSSTINNSLGNEQFNASQQKVCFSDKAFVSQNVTEDRNMFGRLLLHASADGVRPASFQQQHALQTHTGMNKSGLRQQEAGRCLPSAGKTSKTATSLDPLEEKILFNTDDSCWGSSLGQQSNVGLAGFDSNREHADFMGTYSSNQSGTWSALMQSAVAEASSSDTGQQEEWSSLTFQNPELSDDNQQTNYIGDGKQSSWVDKNLHSISSPTSKSEISFQNSNPNCSFPTLQQSHNVVRPKQGMHLDSPHDFVQQSSKNAHKWFEQNSQHKANVEGWQPMQARQLLQNAWHNQQSEDSQNDRHQPSIFPCMMSGQSGTNLIGNELNENVWLHESGSQPMVCGGQKLPDQKQAYVRKYVDNIANVGISSEKVLSADFETNSRASEELPPRNNADSIATLFDSSAAFSGQRISYNPSGNRLQLLNKADKSVEIRSGTHLCSRDLVPSSQLSQIENCNLFYTTSASQGFNLRLATPSERLPKSCSAFGSPSLASSSAINASGPLYLNSRLQNQWLAVTPVAGQMPQVAVPAFTGILQASAATPEASDLFQTSLQGEEFPRLESLPVTQLTSTSFVPQEIGHSMRLPNMSQNSPSQTEVLQSDVPNVFSVSLSSPYSTNINADTARGAQLQQYKQISFQDGVNIKETNACSPTRQGYDSKEDQMDQLNPSGVSTSFRHDTLDHVHEAVGKHMLGARATASVPMYTATHCQAFDRVEHRDNNAPNVSGNDNDVSLRSLSPPDLQQKFTLLHQVNGHARQQMLYGLKSGVTNLAVGDQNPNSQLYSDNEPMTCSSKVIGDQPGKPSSKVSIQGGILKFEENGIHSHPKAQSQVYLQMAPSWSEPSGSMKNGQMRSMYDLMHSKEVAKQLSIGQVNSSIASLPSSILPNSATEIVPAKELQPLFVMPLDDSQRNLAVSAPKKRKLASYDILPWHKEVTNVLQQLQTVSMAESEWALASNRLSEKVVDEAEMVEYVFPISRAKKRLLSTTQLTQKIFRPAPIVLSPDAFSNAETMIYFVARLALGDACSMTSSCERPPLTSDVSSENLRTSERVGQLEFFEAVEKFIDRARRLGDELFRLDKTVSFVDIKVDSQELERFSVINRFARFHSRGHIVSVNTSSSGANPGVHKTSPQRYVVAHPMPKVVPEGVNCISL
ncbi:unnamed protein product [Coffea canephora]|uniref:Uncharacterized protein n=1 Tax=Coffea canephora TaxID=49390 RepID=A0A068U1A4_COFCA|nr:unnamed protein product [Coffea canephora]